MKTLYNRLRKNSLWFYYWTNSKMRKISLIFWLLIWTPLTVWYSFTEWYTIFCLVFPIVLFIRSSWRNAAWDATEVEWNRFRFMGRN